MPLNPTFLALNLMQKGCPTELPRSESDTLETRRLRARSSRSADGAHFEARQKGVLLVSGPHRRRAACRSLWRPLSRLLDRGLPPYRRQLARDRLLRQRHAGRSGRGRLHARPGPFRMLRQTSSNIVSRVPPLPMNFPTRSFVRLLDRLTAFTQALVGDPPGQQLRVKQTVCNTF